MKRGTLGQWASCPLARMALFAAIAAFCVAMAPAPSFATPTPENTPDYFVEWVQPNGKLYVDTGIIAKDGIKAETYLQHVKTDGVTYPAMLGAFLYTGNKRFMPCGFANNNIRLQYGASYNDAGPGSVLYGDECLIETEYPVGSQLTGRATMHNGTVSTAALDGTTKGGPIDTGISLYLFAVHMYRNNSSYAQDYHTGRLYYCKIWQTNGVDVATYVPVRDYRPCVKDGVACVYDAVSETIFYPEENTLKAGPAIPDGWPAAARTGNVDHPATQWGRIAYAKRSVMADSTWKDVPLGDYTAKGDGDTSNLNASGKENATGTWIADNAQKAQVRFDGWFQVSADKAGDWSINQKYDDYFAFFIDGRNVLYNNTYKSEENATVSVSEGWHRFTIICGDTSGGYGSIKNYGGSIGLVPFAITVGGTAYAFNNTNFPQGSGSNSLTLDTDADWTSVGPILLSGGAVLDLNGHNLTVDDIVSDGFVGAMVTNSAATKSVLYFTGTPVESMAVANGLVKGAGYGIVLAQAGEKIAFWTGAANNGVATDPANWRDASGATVTPDGTYDVKLAGQNVNLQIPTGSTFACKTLDIGDCTLTADCDLSGLAPTATISGTANLDGHVLTLPALAAEVGATFAGGEGSAVAFPVDESTTHGSLGEDEYIADIGNLALSGDAKIVLVKDGAGGTLSATTMWLGETHNAEFSQTNGTVNLGSTRTYLGGKLVSGGRGVYRMSGGKLVSAGEFTLGAKGTAEFIQTGGDITFQNWFNIGRHGGTGTYTVTGGSMTNTYNQPLYLGCEGGTGTLNAGGDASLQMYRLVAGGLNDNYTSKGYVNISGNAVVAVRSWGSVSQKNKTYGEVNQTGGKLILGGDIVVGEASTGVYNMSAGELSAQGYLYVSKNASTASKGTFTQSGGKVAAKDVRVGYGVGATGLYTLSNGTVEPLYWVQVGATGTGKFVQNGGNVLIEGQNNNKLQLADSATGYGTYIINDGLLRVQNGIIAGRLGKGVFEMNGGTVIATNITCGSGTSIVTLNAGTLKPTGPGTFIASLDALTFGRDIKIDTAGFNVSVAGETLATEGSVLTKKGEGTLTFAAPPPVGTLKVERGTVAFSAGGDNTAAVSLAHRWSFNGSTEEECLADSVDTSLSATKIGSAVAFTDGEAVMTGNGNSTGSLNLGVGIVPRDSATIEIWATRTAYRKFARIFDFAASTTNYAFMSWYMAGATTKDRIEIYDDGITTRKEATMAYADNAKYHISMTLVANADGSTTASWTQRDAGTGDVLGSGTFTRADWTLARLVEGNFYLGHSAFTGDADAHAKYDEVRIWRGALSDAALVLSATKGPDATAEDIAAILAANEAAAPSMRAIEIASGATLDVGAGNTLRQSVITANGTLAGGNLVVTKRVDATVGETMTVASGATLDLTGADVVVTDPENMPQEGWVFATSPSGGIASAAPRKLGGALTGYTLFITPTKARIGRAGMVLFVR